MRLATLSALSAATLTSSALATVSSTLVADTYVVKDGTRFYSVLDVYVKGDHVGDVMSSVVGTTGHDLVMATSQAQGVTRDAAGRITGGSITSDIFTQAGGSGWLPTYTGSGQARRWDSFVANGNRTQGASVTNRGGSVVDLGNANNWSSSLVAGDNYIANSASNAWYSTRGSNAYATAGASENPFARISLYNATWNSTYADLDRSRLASNGAMKNGAASASAAWADRVNPLAGPIAGGASLDFHWMIGRFAIETTGKSSSEQITLNVQFTMIGKHGSTSESGTTFTGTLDTRLQVSQFFAFAVPAPGAIGLIWPLMAASRRRRA